MLKLSKKSFLTLKSIPKPTGSEFETFLAAYSHYKHEIDAHPNASETNIEEYASHFLRDAFGYSLHKSENIDKTIQANGIVQVAFEFKAPSNKNEMITIEAPNRKALHESVYYFMRERAASNNELKRIVVTNGVEWYIFDTHDFERLFWLNSDFNRRFRDFEKGILTDDRTKHFYDEIAKPFIASATSKNGLLDEDATLEVLHFDIRTIDDEAKQIAFFKALSKPYLLKEAIRSDPNHLDRNFYAKLLELMGLEEVRDGGKKTIQRCSEVKRKHGSMLENTIASIPRSRRNPPPDLESAALSLVIIWINRILFLKLLESQLLRYHKGDENYRFLSFAKLDDYDKLNSLFFEALAKPKSNRAEKYKQFDHIPYLNSSLFELSVEEDALISISSLEDEPNFDGEHLLKKMFAFLDSYDFGAEEEESVRRENKTLISAAVLGLVFEKINGYKDGSFYTPSFITQYMARETVTKAILQKFKEQKEIDCADINSLNAELIRHRLPITEVAKIVDSITVCDPAVGSGHFLVSCLNELIYQKSKLGLIPHRCEIEIVDDELVVWDEVADRQFFYQKSSVAESAKLQKTLFEEKRRIIENQLFGVDINPNSVNICRLRLWIELLKNAYHREDGELETLPNIDINIKCGNSLISRFTLDDDKQLLEALKLAGSSIERYKFYTAQYKEAKTKEEKRVCEDELNRLRAFVPNRLKRESPKIKELEKLTKEYHDKYGGEGLSQEVLELYSSPFKQAALFEAKVDERAKKAHAKKIEALNSEIAELQSGKIYENAFEWRFEFPEVLGDAGNFTGFDIVIGNPPYIPLSKLKDIDYSRFAYKTFDKTGDILALFFERGAQILKGSGALSFIVSNSWLRTRYGEAMKSFFTSNIQATKVLNFEDTQVFDEATVESCIVTCSHKKSSIDNEAGTLTVKNIRDFDPKSATAESLAALADGEIRDDITASLMRRIEAAGKPLKEWKVSIYRGVLTGFNEAFIIDSAKRDELIAKDKNSENLLQPILQGRDMKKYVSHWGGKWLITMFPSLKLNIDDYPAVKEYLSSFGKRLEQSGEKGSRKKTSNKWFETQDQISYWQDFAKPKIIWGQISDLQKFSYSENHFFTSSNEFIMSGEYLKYLLAVLNSKLALWYFEQISTTTGVGTTLWTKHKIELLPIAETDDDTPFVTLVDQILKLKKMDCHANARNDKIAASAMPPRNDEAAVTEGEARQSEVKILEAKIDQMIYVLYGLTEDEIAIVEGKK